MNAKRMVAALAAPIFLGALPADGQQILNGGDRLQTELNKRVETIIAIAPEGDINRDPVIRRDAGPNGSDLVVLPRSPSVEQLLRSIEILQQMQADKLPRAANHAYRVTVRPAASRDQPPQRNGDYGRAERTLSRLTASEERALPGVGTTRWVTVYLSKNGKRFAKPVIPKP